MELILLLQGAPGGGMESLLSSILPFVLIIAIFYFLILRPQQKKQKERQKLLESVKKGDKVVTAGGIYGTVDGIEDNLLLVKIAEGVKVKMDRSAISTIIGVTDVTPAKK
ncbi:MAG TPA: preprotein translocase subunit YajC [Ignavibacteria bacterium]|nr:preprotein translocase subunit YajC [Ignavibacteria bacterium]